MDGAEEDGGERRAHGRKTTMASVARSWAMMAATTELPNLPATSTSAGDGQFELELARPWREAEGEIGENGVARRGIG